MTHLLEVAHILADMKMDATTLTPPFFMTSSKTQNSCRANSGKIWR